MPVRSPKWLLLASLLLAAPDTPGIIELWDDDELVYVGEAVDSIRRHLVRAIIEEHSWQDGATHFGWEITTHPDARQQELLDEFEATFHRPPRFNL